MHYIRFAPSSTVTIQGKANLLEVNKAEIQRVFTKKRVLRLIIKAIQEGNQETMTFIRIKPKQKILCHGLGYNVLKMRKKHVEAGYSVIIPQDRLFKDIE